MFYYIILEENGEFKPVCVGEYSGVTRTLHLEKCEEIFWIKKPPKDRTNIRIIQTFINPTIFTIVVVIACVGILLALTFLAINIRFRHERFELLKYFVKAKNTAKMYNYFFLLQTN